MLRVLASTAAPKEAAGSRNARRGWAVPSKGKPLQLTSFEYATPLGANDVEINVVANGLCHSDLHMVGANVSKERVGQRVGVGWLSNSCRCCSACIRGEENICEKGYQGLIVGPDSRGGFANSLRVSSDFTYVIPDELSSEAAAPLLCAGSDSGERSITVYAPIRRWVKPGSRVAVLGVGGLGHLATQFADAFGGIVTAIDIDASKAEEAKRLRASAFVPFTEYITKNYEGAFDVVLNTIPVKLDTAAILASLAPNGTCVQVGLPAHDPVMAVPLLTLVFGQKRVVGSIVGGRTDMNEMLRLCAAKGIEPMVQLAPLSDVNAQMERVRAGEARYRIVLLSDEEWEKKQAGS